jgi:hypothetical protein
MADYLSGSLADFNSTKLARPTKGAAGLIWRGAKQDFGKADTGIPIKILLLQGTLNMVSLARQGNRA